MKKRAVIIIILIISLTLLSLVSYYFNKASIDMQKEILENAQILLKYDNKEVLLNKDEIHLYNEEFEAILDTSDSEASIHKYRGVELRDLLDDKKIDYQNKSIIIKAADAYSVAYSWEEVSREANVYIAFMEDGRYLGDRKSGGRGPYESIVLSDMFSNRRCKWITKIEVK